MELFTWISAISTKEQFSALISLVEEGSLEEMFIAKSSELGVAAQKWPVSQPLVFSFSASADVKEKLQKISSCIDLDTLNESYFEEIDGVHSLKSVFYPESELEEEKIISQLA